MSAPSQRERIAELEWELDRHPDCYAAKWSDVTDEDRQTYLRHADRVLAALTPSDPPADERRFIVERNEHGANIRVENATPENRYMPPKPGSVEYREGVKMENPYLLTPSDQMIPHHWTLADYQAEFRRMLSICPDEGAMRVWLKPEHLRTLLANSPSKLAADDADLLTRDELVSQAAEPRERERIVLRLRNLATHYATVAPSTTDSPTIKRTRERGDLLWEAADEIERLAAALERPAAVREPASYFCDIWRILRCSECYQAIEGKYACEGGDQCPARNAAAQRAPEEPQT